MTQESFHLLETLKTSVALRSISASEGGALTPLAPAEGSLVDILRERGRSKQYNAQCDLKHGATLYVNIVLQNEEHDNFEQN